MKVLVISLAGNGDTLFATPLIHELRANFPGAEIDVLVRWRAARDLLKGNPHLNTVYQKDLEKEGAWASLQFLLGLRRNHYDVSFNAHPQSRLPYRAVARVIGARIRASHEYECSGVLDRWLVNRSIPQDYQKHAVENNLALLPFAEATPLLPKHEYELYLSAEDMRWAEAFISAHQLGPRACLGLHVGSGGTKNLAQRRWPVVNYLALIQMVLTARSDVSVLLFGGPDEEEAHATIRSQTDATRVLQVNSQTLRQAAALIQKCRVFLSVDTVMMHLAAAVKVRRQIVIETPTWNKPIEPYGQPFVLVPNPAVAGRNLEFYRYDGRDIQGTPDELARCMASVTVPAVSEKVLEALG